MNRELFFSSKSDEWSTPWEIFNELDQEFGFDLDPCATAENHKCANYYTKEDDGIVKNWGGAECFATRRTPRSASGWRRHTGKAPKTGRSWSFSYQPGPTPATSTILFCTGRKSVLYVGASNLETRRTARPSRAWSSFLGERGRND